MELTIHTIDLPKEYGITDAAIAEIAAKYQDLKEIKDATSLAMAVAGRRECRELRVAVEHKRKELKADALEFGRKVDGEAKRITAKLEEIETPLDDLIKKEEARKQAEREEKERIERERIMAEEKRVAFIKARIEESFGAARLLSLHTAPAAKIAPFLDSFPEVSPEEFGEFCTEAAARREEFLAQARQILAEKCIAEAEAERQRIETEQLAEERRRFEEEQRIAREKAEAEDRERARIEEERQAAIRAEQEKIETERRRLREEQEAIEAEKRRIEEERLAKVRAEEEEQRRKAMEEQARQRAEQEIKERLEREERERKDREDAERLVREREEFLRPDREKLKLFAASLIATPFPTLTTPEGHKACARIEKKLDALAEFIVSQAEKLSEELEVVNG